MNAKRSGTACALLAVGLLAIGCGEQKHKVTAPDKAVTPTATAAGSAAVTNGKVAPPKFDAKSREERVALRAQQHQALLDQAVQAQQQAVTNLIDVAREMYEVEAAARTNSTVLQAAHEAMTRTREDYEAKVAALPEMKPLTARREELQETYRKMSERKQLLEQEKTTP